MKKHLNFLALAILLVVTSIWTSCKKEAVTEGNSTTEMPTEGMYKKKITLTSGESWMKIEVSSDDAALLETAAVTALTLKEIDENIHEGGSGNVENLTNEGAPSNPLTPIFVNILEQHAAAGVKDIAIFVPGNNFERNYCQPYWFTAACGWGVHAWSNYNFSGIHNKYGNCGATFLGGVCPYTTNYNTHYGSGKKHNLYVNGVNYNVHACQS